MSDLEIISLAHAHRAVADRAEPRGESRVSERHIVNRMSFLLMHGWLKVGTFGLAGVSGYMVKLGLEPSIALAALLLGIVMVAIAIRGGGPYSVDRMIGKEL